MELIEDTYIPNNALGQAILPLQEGDTFIYGTSFMNATPWKVRLFTAGQVEDEYFFFDKSNASLWKDEVRASDNYVLTDTGLFDSSEIQQQWIYDNVMDGYKYQWWSRVNSNFTIHNDLFFYGIALTGSNICEAKKYVKLGETITDLTGMESEFLCNNDVFKE